MNPVAKKLWEDALLSGRYKQGYFLTYNAAEDCHCALGVLCEVAIQQGVSVTRCDQGYAETCAGRIISEVFDTKLPTSVAAWAELNFYTPYAAPQGAAGPVLYITSLNDLQKQSFQTIGGFLKTLLPSQVK